MHQSGPIQLHPGLRSWRRTRGGTAIGGGFGDNDSVTLFRDDGVVLRVQKLGEADRIVTMLTRRTGRVRAVAKGVRRTKSKFGGRLEPFSHVDAQFYVGRSPYIV